MDAILTLKETHDATLKSLEVIFPHLTRLIKARQRLVCKVVSGYLALALLLHIPAHVRASFDFGNIW